MNYNSDTICALATPTCGALAVIRISGPRTHAIVGEICGSNTERTLRHTFVRDKQGEVVDEVMLSLFHAPHSYTGEDAAEISCHGSPYIARQILDMLIQHGCRMAAPGEFTQRAFLNGKMDLSQAEAVADLIASTNRATHQMAMNQLRGRFSSELTQLRDRLLRLTTLLELELDFSDHEDLEFADRTELLQLARFIDKRILQLADSFQRGQALKNGIPVAIIGKTNVGKSTLLNQLVGDDRAIISDIHGTTRDTIEDEIEIDGIRFRFIDTAGLRQTADEIERIGIERTMKAVEKARIVIWLFDTRPSLKEMDEMSELTRGKRCINVLNKADLYDMNRIVPFMVPMSFISAKNGTYIDSLKRRIIEEARVDGLLGNDSDVIVSNARHYEALLRAHESIFQVTDGLTQNLPADLIAEDLRLVLSTLGEITGGTITSQETLNNIFEHFCVGK